MSWDLPTGEAVTGVAAIFNIGLFERMLRQHPLHTTVSLFF